MRCAQGEPQPHVESATASLQPPLPEYRVALAVDPNMTQIGNSDLDVLPLSLGGNVFGWTADRDASFRILDSFIAGGGDFIDTADGYSAWVPGNSGGESDS